MTSDSVGDVSATTNMLLGIPSGAQAQAQHSLTETEEISLLGSFTESCTVCAKPSAYQFKQPGHSCAVGLFRKIQTHGGT